MSGRAQRVFEEVLQSNEDPRAVIEQTVQEEETVTCPDCDTDFPKDTGYCPSCEEKKDISEAKGSLGELPAHKLQDLEDRFLNEFGMYADQPTYANFQLNETRQRRINGHPAFILEVRTSEKVRDEDRKPEAEMYYVVVSFNRETNEVTTKARRGDASNGQQVNDQTTFYTESVLDFNEQYMRSLVSRVIDDINVDFLENVA